MVGNQQVYKTPSASVAVAMANLDRFPDTPEYQDIRTNIRALLIAAMGQTATLLKTVQAVSYTEVTFDQTHHSRTHRDLVGTIVAVHLSIIEGRTPVTTIVVGMLVVTTNKDADMVRR